MKRKKEDARQLCDYLPCKERAVFRTSRPGPSTAKRRRLGMTEKRLTIL